MISFIKESIAEMRHVTWPSKQQATFMTVLVVVISIVVALMLFVFDEFFGSLVARLVSMTQ